LLYGKTVFLDICGDCCTETFLNGLRLLSRHMEALIMNFRQGRHNQKPNQMILKVPGVETKEKATKFVGKKVTYTTPSGKKITGQVSAPHGNKGAVRALFEKGLPGQSLTKHVLLE
jgi:large subunit ribosomal protein L35Ae